MGKGSQEKTWNLWAFSGGSDGKESACNAGDTGLIPGSGRSPGEGKGYPIQYSGLENSMDYMSMGSQSQTQPRDFHFYTIYKGTTFMT